MTENTTPRSISRRTVATAAAWTVPAVAVAASAPLAAASVTPPADFDVTVTAAVTNGADVTLLGGGLVNTILGLLGLPRAVLEYRITATTGTIPVGTQFTLQTGGLVNLSLLGSQLVGLSVLTSNTTTATIVVTTAIPQSQTRTISLLGGALLNVGAVSTSSLALVGTDSPTGTGKNSASILTGLVTTTTVLNTTLKVVAGASVTG